MTIRNPVRFYDYELSFAQIAGEAQSSTFVELAKEKQHEMNPWADEKVSALQFLRFQLLREVAIRDAEMRLIFWRHLGYKELLLAEAEAETYESLYRDVFALEQMYTSDKYLQKDIESFMSTPIESFIKTTHANIKDARAMASSIATMEHPIANINRHARIRISLLRELMPVTSEVVPRYVQYTLGNFPLEALIHKSADSHEATWIASWMHRFGGLQAHVLSSMAVLEQDWAFAGILSNVLTGLSGKSRVLLVNGDISKPSLATFPAWFIHCGISFRKLSAVEQVQYFRLCGDRAATHQLTYITPMMPMTKEHTSQSAMISADVHADHSLPFKSPGHFRHSNGAMDLGSWLATSVLMNLKEGWKYRFAEHFPPSGDLNGRVIFDMHHSLLPYHPRFDMIDSVFTGTFSPVELESLRAPITDAYLASPWLIPFAWPHRKIAIDMPWRSLAKERHLHFRFDPNEAGHKALNAWRDAFEATAMSYASANGWQRSLAILSAAHTQQAVLMSLTAQQRKTRKDGSASFDFSMLG